MDRLYYAPEAVDEALALVAEHGRAGLVAGGTDLVVRHRSGKRPLPKTLVGIHALGELGGIAWEGHGRIALGALVTYSAILSSAEIAARFTALADASAIVGSPATRYMGTLGGNIVNASPAMDTGAPLLVLEGLVELRSKARTRRVPITQLWTGPGESVLADDELLTSISIPPLPPGSGSAYVRLEYRRAMEIAVVGAAAAVTLGDDANVTKAAVALSAVAPTCFVADTVAPVILGHRLDGRIVAQAAEAAAAEARPISDNRGSASYRARMVSVITARALRVAAARAVGRDIPVPASQNWRLAETPREVKREIPTQPSRQ